MNFAILLLLLSILASFIAHNWTTEEMNPNYKRYLRFKELYEKTGNKTYKGLRDHYHQEWVNETTDG